jgi:hypothetical protein
MTSAQFAWSQFSLHHIRRESGDDERLDAEKTDDNEESYDMPVPFTTSKTSRTTSPNSKNRVQRSKHTATKHSAIISPAAPAVGHEPVKKAKTRSERRAEEPEEPEQAQEPVPPRKERRSDYWIQRDDLRRGNARTMKTQFQFQE